MSEQGGNCCTAERKLSITPSEIAAILAKWGPAVLTLIEDGLSQGFTFSFLEEILSTLGPLFLQFAVKSKAHMNAAKLTVASPIIVGAQTDPTVTATNPIVVIAIQALIGILQSQGPAISAAVVSWLIQVLQSQENQPALAAAISDALAKK
jgi:hypothetical protein